VEGGRDERLERIPHTENKEKSTSRKTWEKTFNGELDGSPRNPEKLGGEKAQKR